jgi:hypothetical protein
MARSNPIRRDEKFTAAGLSSFHSFNKHHAAEKKIKHLSLNRATKHQSKAVLAHAQ